MSQGRERQQRGKKLFLAMVFAVLTFSAKSALAENSKIETCTIELEQRRDELQALVDDIKRDGMTDAALSRLLTWRDAFKISIQRNGLLEMIEGLGVGTGLSVLASLALESPPGWAAATLGSALSLAYVGAKNLILTVGSWAKIDGNTAFYQFLLDYLEYGRVGSVEDDNLLDFVSTYSSLLNQLTGSTPPSGGPALALYLQAHAEQLLFFFGYFEEKLGADAFPRWKFPETAGRFGPSRLNVGYYRDVLGERLALSLEQLKREIAALQNAACQDQPTALPEIKDCRAPPAPGETTTCYCRYVDLGGMVWGVDLYTNDSSICTAAIHAGILRPRPDGNGGVEFSNLVEMVGRPGCPYYKGQAAFGITSQPYHGWNASFYFPATQSGLCEPNDRPQSADLWYCPAKLPEAVKDLRCHCPAEATKRGDIWGTQIYSGDSSICRAAVHAGALGPAGGTVRVIELGPLDRYEGSEANGIVSHSGGGWPRSIGFP